METSTPALDFAHDGSRVLHFAKLREGKGFDAKEAALLLDAPLSATRLLLESLEEQAQLDKEGILYHLPEGHELLESTAVLPHERGKVLNVIGIAGRALTSDEIARLTLLPSDIVLQVLLELQGSGALACTWNLRTHEGLWFTPDLLGRLEQAVASFEDAYEPPSCEDPDADDDEPEPQTLAFASYRDAFAFLFPRLPPEIFEEPRRIPAWQAILEECGHPFHRGAVIDGLAALGKEPYPGITITPIARQNARGYLWKVDIDYKALPTDDEALLVASDLPPENEEKKEQDRAEQSAAGAASSASREAGPLTPSSPPVLARALALVAKQGFPLEHVVLRDQMPRAVVEMEEQEGEVPIVLAAQSEDGAQYMRIHLDAEARTLGVLILWDEALE